ncbi:MAG: glutamate--tRNA ligase [Rhodospirillaceae bacterium]|nr:glutamate--tRNA ligase [Rhodospirillaceae bacterium]
MTVVTRFAPSPTGFLHIGGARTALFNWLYAKHTGGKYLLRIEDTDRARSTQPAIDAIIDGLTWMGLQWDGDVVFQFARADRHRAAVEKLLASGNAYRCYASPEELTAMREEQKAKGLSIRYDGRWRDRDPSEAPAGVKPAIRLRAPTEGETVINDLVQGTVTVANAQLDDMVLLRGDGTPTYMLSVVVDDIDMNVTHVIRGDDHLNNAFRQLQLIRALGAPEPTYAHVPLIHGQDGAKLSKRHGALGVEAYRDMGFLPEAMRNYLLRLGWGHGDEEIIPDAKAVEWFDIKDVGRAPSRFDMDKLSHLNAYYLKETDDRALVDKIVPDLESKAGPVSDAARLRLTRGMHGLKQRAKTLKDLAEGAAFYVAARPLTLDDKAKAAPGDGGKENLAKILPHLESATVWSAEHLENWAKAHAETHGLKLGKLLPPIRAAVCGTLTSPAIFEVLEALGKDESLARIRDVTGA